jgi:hypothetical protein
MLTEGADKIERVAEFIAVIIFGVVQLTGLL